MIPRIPTIVSPRRGFARVVEAPGPVLGTISDLAAVAGDGQVTLSWTAAANATSHQPQYRAQGSGTWLNFGPALGGSANAVTVTGLTPGTPYEFCVVASDGSATTTSNVVTATPEAGGGVQPLFADSFESGDLSHSEGGFSWSGEWARVYVSSNRARTGTYSLAFDYTSGSAEETFHLGGQYPEVWMERWIWIPADYAHGNISGSTTNNKFFAMYGDRYGSNGNDRAQMILELWDIEQGDSRLRVMVNPDGGPTGFTQGFVNPFISDSGPMFRGQWNRVRLYASVGTAGGSDNGIIRIWVGDARVYNQTDAPFYPAGGTHPYFEHGYLWGSNNGDYAAPTIFYEDDFKVYTSDPGWL